MPNAIGGLQQIVAQAATQSGTPKKEIASLQKSLSEIGKMPGGADMLFSLAAKDLVTKTKREGGPKQMRLYDMGEQPTYARGGLANAAQTVQKAGKNGDEIILHLAPEEFEAIENMWGPAERNEETGMPAYGFLSKAWKGVKKAVKKVVENKYFATIAPIALSLFVPGIGTAIGAALGAGSGIASAALGQAVISGAVGAATGKRGSDLFKTAAIGAVAGGAGKAISGASMMGDAPGVTGAGLQPSGATTFAAPDLAPPISTTSLMGAGEGLAPISGLDIAGAEQAFQMPLAPPTPTVGAPLEGLAPGMSMEQLAQFDPGAINAPTTVAPAPFTGGVGGGGIRGVGAAQAAAPATLMDKAIKYGIPALSIAGALQGPPKQPGPEDLGIEGETGFGEPMQQFKFSRQQQIPQDFDYYTYGQQGGFTPESSFFTGNTVANMQALVPDPVTGEYITQAELDQRKAASAQASATPALAAMGGYQRGGGSGRDDTIEARLSDGEYVMDAESVAMLGDGSNNEGARRLDSMRTNLRKHKGQNLRKGKFSADARRPASYLPKLARLRQASQRV